MPITRASAAGSHHAPPGGVSQSCRAPRSRAAVRRASSPGCRSPRRHTIETGDSGTGSTSGRSTIPGTSMNSSLASTDHPRLRTTRTNSCEPSISGNGAAQRGTEPPVAPRSAARTRSPLRLPGIPPLLLTFVCTGAVFGSAEVVTLAYADAHGIRAAGGALLALQAAGSAAAGLLYGLLRPAAGQGTRRLRRCLTAMAALMPLPLPAAVAGGPAAVAVALAAAGTATAPAMVTGMGLVQSRTPAERLNEGMTLAVTAPLAGTAAGSATGGRAVEHLTGPGLGYAVPAAAAALALCTSLRRPARTGGTQSSGP